jgi:hypothetical protein
MGLRETLEAANQTRLRHDARTRRAIVLPTEEALDAQNTLRALAPELAAEVLELRERHREAMALALDMGEYLKFETNEWALSLLARLDQLGKEQTP